MFLSELHDILPPKLFLKHFGEGYFFKLSHAIGHALVVVLQLHLIEQQRV